MIVIIAKKTFFVLLVGDFQKIIKFKIRNLSIQKKKIKMSLNSLGTSNGGLPSSRMTHSLSTPSGVDGSASTNHTRGGGKKLAVRVQMLDDSMTLFQVQVCRIWLFLFYSIFLFL